MIVTKGFIETLERSTSAIQGFINDLEKGLPDLKGMTKEIVETAIEQYYQDIDVIKGVIQREKAKEPIRGTTTGRWSGTTQNG